MMNKVFQAEIGDMLEVYMDDMTVKSKEEAEHTAHLRRVFEQARKCKMRFNPTASFNVSSVSRIFIRPAASRARPSPRFSTIMSLIIFFSLTITPSMDRRQGSWSSRGTEEA
jgi:hypothetical protein